MTKQLLEGKDLELMKTCLFLEQDELHDYLLQVLEDKYDYIFQRTGVGIYAKGDLPVILLAHLDTVHKVKPTEDTLFYDTEKNQMACINNGIGADCRAGVFNILQLLDKGYRPHVLFSWDEEIGCVGTGYFVNILESTNATGTLLQEYMKEINFAVQFDRRGFSEAVYYDLDSQEFENYISSFGFATKFGSYTDIAELCPSAGFAGVNVSAGYTDEHTKNEILHVNELLSTQQKVENILIDQMKNPYFFEYKGLPKYQWGKTYYGSDSAFYASGAQEDPYDGYYYEEPILTSSKTVEEETCFICDEPLIIDGNWDDRKTNISKTQAITCFDCRDMYYGKEAIVPQWWVDKMKAIGIKTKNEQGSY